MVFFASLRLCVKPIFCVEVSNKKDASRQAVKGTKGQIMMSITGFFYVQL